MVNSYLSHGKYTVGLLLISDAVIVVRSLFILKLKHEAHNYITKKRPLYHKPNQSSDILRNKLPIGYFTCER